jgi:RNA-directed DNA polymerase
MKRLAIELGALAAYDNLALAAYKAAAGKRRHPEVAAFLANLGGQLKLLASSILQATAPTGQARRFFISDPKHRQITAPCFADRVLHHAIFNLAEPRLETALTDVAFACRPGRGVHAAVFTVQRNLQRYAWVVQVDVAHYFDNINHAVLLALLARRFKGPGFLALLQRIVAGDSTATCGLPIGALTSQHFANAYLDSADRLLLQQPGVGAAVRYMDDMVWFCQSQNAAQASLQQLRQHLSSCLLLTLKDRVVLRPSRQGLLFCGYRVRQGVVLAGPRKLKRYRQAVCRLQQAQADDWPGSLLQRAHAGAAAALLPAQSTSFTRALWWPHGAEECPEQRLASWPGCAS